MAVRAAGERQVELVRALGRPPLPGGRGARVEVGGEQAAEEHHLAGDEEQHPEQRGRHPRLPVRNGRCGSCSPAGAPASSARSYQRPLRRSTSSSAVSSRSAGRSAAWPWPWVRKKSGRSRVDRRQPVEVVGRRRRGRRPLERVPLPRVVAGRLAVDEGGDHVDQERDDAGRDHERADRRDEVQHVQPASGL